MKSLIILSLYSAVRKCFFFSFGSMQTDMGIEQTDSYRIDLSEYFNGN